MKSAPTTHPERSVSTLMDRMDRTSARHSTKKTPAALSLTGAGNERKKKNSKSKLFHDFAYLTMRLFARCPWTDTKFRND